MNNIPLVLRRPKIPNIIKLMSFCALTCITICGAVFVFGLSPKTQTEKVLSIFFYCVFMFSFVFTFTSFLNAFRNLFSKPTLILENDKITLFRFGEIPLCMLDKIEINEKKKMMNFFLKNGTSVQLKRSVVNLPLDTIKYAIEERIKCSK